MALEVHRTEVLNRISYNDKPIVFAVPKYLNDAEVTTRTYDENIW